MHLKCSKSHSTANLMHFSAVQMCKTSLPPHRAPQNGHAEKPRQVYYTLHLTFPVLSPAQFNWRAGDRKSLHATGYHYQRFPRRVTHTGDRSLAACLAPPTHSWWRERVGKKRVEHCDAGGLLEGDISENASFWCSSFFFRVLLNVSSATKISTLTLCSIWAFQTAYVPTVSL